MFTGLHSWSFRDAFKADPGFTLECAIETTAQLGFTALEVMAGAAGSKTPGDFAQADLPYLYQIQKFARTRNVRFTCLSTYNDFAFTKNEAWRLANIAYVKTWTRIAGDLGISNLRLLTGYWVDGESRDKLESLVESAIAECLPVAEAAGVNLCLENHSSVFLSYAQTAVLMRRLNSPRLTACPDPSNWLADFFNRAPGDPERNAVLADSAAYIRRATNSHLKIPGVTKGEIHGWSADLRKLLQSYRDAGYAGPIVFESICEGDLLGSLAEARLIVEREISALT